MSEPLVIIGNGMAAVHLVDELAKRALGRYAIAVVGEEPRLAYNRVLLSAVLAREVSRSDIELRSARWWDERGVTLLYGRTATAIDPTIRRVRLADGATLPYSRLVLATGSRPIRLGVSGVELPGVMTFRDLADVAAIEAAAQRRARVVVIGGGLLGLEAAHGLAKAGAQVTVVHLMDRLMARQLDGQAAGMLKKAVEARGMTVLLNSETVAIIGKRRVQAVALKNGPQIEADLVVVAAGIRPNIELAHGGGLNVDRGIVVDDSLRTSRPDIFAIGDLCEHQGERYGPACQISLRLENAPSTAGSATDLSSRPTSRHAFLPRSSRAKPHTIPGACSPRISRFPASTCFRPAILSVLQAPSSWFSQMSVSASTRSW